MSNADQLDIETPEAILRRFAMQNLKISATDGISVLSMLMATSATINVGDATAVDDSGRVTAYV